MRRFQEYLNAKGVMKEKPDVAVLAKKLEVDPPAKGKGGASIPKELKPMKNGKQAQIKEGRKSKDAKGFGDQGDKNLIYDVEKTPKAAKIPTAEAYQLLPQIRESLASDPHMVEALVRDLKRSGLLAMLVAELSQHKETFGYLAELMGHNQYGPVICKKLARAMKENVALPFAKQGDEELDDEEDEDEEAVPEDDMEDPAAMGDEEMGAEDPMADPAAMGGDPNAMDPMAAMGAEGDPSMDPAAMEDPMMGGDVPPPDAGGAPQVHHHHNPVHHHVHHHHASPAMENLRQAMKLVF